MEINSQPIEKPVYREDGALEVHSIWDTIQGEGPFAGTPATFVRLAGCNLQCQWCDTEYSSQRAYVSPSELISKIHNLPDRDLIVITGGEPFRQNIKPFVDMVILEFRKKIQIETNGTLWNNYFGLNPSSRACIVCSPKTPKLNQDISHYISAFKYVVSADNIDTDGLPLTSVGPQYGRPARPPKEWEGEIYVQPLDEEDEEKNKRNTQAAVQSCMEHGYLLTLQMHKLVGLD